MKLYIELYIINNFFINLFINILTIKLTRQSIIKYRLILTTLFEALVSVVYVYIDINNVFLKIFLLFIIIALLTKNNSIFVYLKNCFIFLVVTFILGGSIYAILLNFNIDIYEISFSLRMLVIYSAIICLLFFMKKILKCTKKIKNKMIFSDNIILYKNDKKLKVMGYYDSGNNMYFKENPVCFISQKTYSRLLNDTTINTIEYVNITSINSKAKLKLIQLDKIQLIEDKKYFYKVFCAVSENLNNYDFLIHADMR